MPVIHDPPDGPQFATTTLVGRRSEREILDNLLVRTTGGRGGTVFISGDAGIGKTTLVEALRQEAQSRGAIVLSSGCYDLTGTPPYGPWLELARSYLPTDTLPAWPKALGDESHVETARNQADIFNELDRFLAAVSAKRTLVLILEDLHWADQASLDLLRVVARRCIELPLLLIATYRSDDLDRSPWLSQLLPVIVREARPERIDVRPLDREAVASMVAQRYEVTSDGQSLLVDYLMHRAGGNPFYTLELLRGLEQQDLLVATDSGWEVNDIESLEVPLLLRQMIDARLARLDGKVQQNLMVGAVIGQHVPIDLWCKTLDVSEANIIRTIEQALQAQLIDASTDGTTISFRHALIRDALYQSILPLRRRRLHQRIGHLLAQSPRPDPDAVAWHLRMAGDEKAADWLIRASEHAERAYAWGSSAEKLIAAEELLADRVSDRDRGWFHYRIGRLRRHADAADAIRWLQSAQDLGMRSQDEALSAFAQFDLGHLLVLTGDYDRGIVEMVAGDRALEGLSLNDSSISHEIIAWIADSLPSGATEFDGAQQFPPETLASVLRRGTLVQWLVEPGRFHEALKLGVEYVDALGTQPPSNMQILSSAGDAWFGLGRAYAAFSDVARSRDAFDRALSCYQSMGHHLLTASTQRVELTELRLPFDTENGAELQRVVDAMETSYDRATGALPSRVPLGFGSIEFLTLRGDWERARELLEPLVEHRATMASWQHRAAALLARILREQGDPTRAWQLMSDVLPDGSRSRPGCTTFSWGLELQFVAVDLFLDQADLPGAKSWLESVDRWMAWSGAQRWRVAVELAWARYHLMRDDRLAARRCAKESLKLASDPHQPLACLSAHRFLGELDIDVVGSAESEQHFSEVMRLADACHAPYERALTELCLAEFRLANGDAESARRLVSASLEVLDRLGALPALERARRLAARLDESGKDQVRPFGLSPRELEVLRLVAQGLTDAEVADQFSISYRTVTTHLTSVFNKLGVNSRVSATRVAVEHKIA